MDVRTRFGVHGDDICTRLGEFSDEGIHRRNHQVNIEWNRGVRADRLHDLRPNGQIGNKMAVHDIYMDHRATARAGSVDLLRQPGKIG